MAPVKCCKQVYGTGRFSSFHGHPCTKAAKVERDGQWYCGTHDPVAVAAKDKKRQAEWEAAQAIRSSIHLAHQKRNAALENLCGHILTEDLGKYELKLKSE